ncbi:hypothetical protein ACHAXT_002393 [Thalassiosira profunda]
MDPSDAPSKRASVATGDSNITEDTDANNGKSNGPFHYPPAFLLRIPKSDLHVHLDGSIRITTLIDLAREHDVSLPSYDPEELKQMVFPETYASLNDYLRGFGYITTVLRTPAALERAAYEVATDAFDVGVRYLELRFAPQLHAIPGQFSIEEVICSVNRGLERAVAEADELDLLSGDSDDGTIDCSHEARAKMERLSKGPHPYHPEAPPHHYGIIACAMRFFLPVFSPYYEAFWEVHKGEDPHRVFGLASVALVTAVNNLRRKGKCCHGCDCGQCNDCIFANSGAGNNGDEGGNESVGECNPTANGHRGKEHDHDYILPVVAIDIAGAESGYPASDHREAFDLAHQSFLNKTVHAGEAYGPESIYESITDLHAERIGHGCNLFNWHVIGEGEGRGGRSKSSREKEELSDDEKRAYIENLVRYLGTMRTCIEVCLSSNLQTMPELEGDLRNHPARKMIEEGLAVTFCTDNGLVSHTDMVKELTLAAEAFELSPGQMRNLVFNGFKRSFQAKRYRAKREYNRKIISYYKKVERQFGLGGYGSDYGDDHRYTTTTDE